MGAPAPVVAATATDPRTTDMPLEWAFRVYRTCEEAPCYDERRDDRDPRETITVHVRSGLHTGRKNWSRETNATAGRSPTLHPHQGIMVSISWRANQSAMGLFRSAMLSSLDGFGGSCGPRGFRRSSRRAAAVPSAPAATTAVTTATFFAVLSDVRWRVVAGAATADWAGFAVVGVVVRGLPVPATAVAVPWNNVSLALPARVAIVKRSRSSLPVQEL